MNINDELISAIKRDQAMVNVMKDMKDWVAQIEVTVLALSARIEELEKLCKEDDHK